MQNFIEQGRPAPVEPQNSAVDSLGTLLQTPVSRRDALRGLATGASLLLAACSGQTPQPPIRQPESIPTPFQEKTEIEPTHLNAVLETLKNTGDPFLGMISDHIKIIRSSPTLPSEFPSWIKRDSTPARVIVNTATESTANMTIQSGNNAYLFRWGGNQAQTIKQPRVEWVSLDNITLAIPDRVKAGGLIEEGVYLVKEWVTHMTNIRFASEFYDVTHGHFFSATDLQGKPLTSKSDQEMAGVAAFSAQMDDRNKNRSDVWRVADAYPTFLVATTLDGLQQKGITTLQRNKLPSFRVANDTYLKSNPEIKALMSETIREWVKAGTFIPPKGITLQAFSDLVFPMIQKFQADPVNR